MFGEAKRVDDLAGGLMPGMACRLHADNGIVFLKAVRADSPAFRLYVNETRVNAALPNDAPSPRLLWTAELNGWLLLVFPCLEGRTVDLSPASPDLPAVLDTLALLGKALTPSPWPTAPAVAANITALQEKAHRLLTRHDVGLPGRDLFADLLSGLDLDEFAGGSLVHYDIHAGNLLVTEQGVQVLDWAFAAAGAPWIDAAMLVPRLIEAGHSPAIAEDLVSRLPAWDSAPSDAVTRLAALWTLFRHYKALFGPADAREARVRATTAGRAWVEHRMALR
ncbi:aminoglycoside phosphotransferase family protein [Pseudofrankia inefficax]|uniref:aminoglycoside phosphotransferase family protein n=1 Tax=Pseudofrankia inefficax (strain DSM 45817 / CECT 9037 / DDB 130130 / EuI1c) TaxID=298654 RepID=UPI0012FD6776|nr:aminoglycoside phosphotransferase family protein [Pseudofrankia inefficax]